MELEGVRVNNLQNISLRIRHHALTVICGVSGSGKSSLAFDTLYAEGQRRYIETFSPSVRQFLDRVERPDADRIAGLPPAIAIRQQVRADGPRSTLGTRTEILDSLRVLFARAGSLICPTCAVPVEISSPESAAAVVVRRCANGRVMIAAELQLDPSDTASQIARLIRQGFTRAIIRQQIVRLDELTASRTASKLLVVIDRLTSVASSQQRLAESIDTAMKLTDGCCVALSETDSQAESAPQHIDDADWYRLRFSAKRICVSCCREFAEPSPERLSFTSPLGACPKCGGVGGVFQASAAARTSRSRKPPIDAVCPECGGSRLNQDAHALRLDGKSLPEVLRCDAGELTEWLSTVFHQLSVELRSGLQPAFIHAQKRLRVLSECGLSYLSLDRSMKSLSGGESQRALLTAVLGSGLINTLYVLDEPTAGLHFADTQRILTAVKSLQRDGNSVVVVEHDPNFILMADEVIELGPGAGAEGGRIVFQGTPESLLQAETATGRQLRLWTHASRARTTERKLRQPEHWLDLSGVRCHNIDALDVRLPLAVFCAVTGVSGSGKSSLIVDAMYPELCKLLEIPCSGSCDGKVTSISNVAQIENVMLLNQSPVQKSRRSIPATWIGVFDEVRGLLAETHEARKRNYSRAMFSFNAASGGRCPVCEGRGVVTVAMQFLADIESVCEECHGRQFRPDILEIRYRDRSVHDILNMTTDEAFIFFNGHHRIQQRLNAVRQAGLGYLRLGQPLSTISGGETQRLRIAAMLAGLPLRDGETAGENRKTTRLTQAGCTLFLLDEPSSGLHLQDLERFLECLDFLVQTGHSVIVIDHDQTLIARADWEIEMGPGAGRLGGHVIYSGPPRR